MNSSLILSITTFIYGLSSFLYIAGWIFKNNSCGRFATWVTISGVIGNVVGFGMRWVESYQLGFGHAPLSNLYESLVFYALTIALLSLFIEWKYGNRIIGAFTISFAFLALAYASLSPNISSQIRPLMPALKSNWLIAHVMTCFIGYAAFAIAFCSSVMYLLKCSQKDQTNKFSGHFPKLETLEELTHRMVMFGFFFHSLGVITGAVWANSAWGRYWGGPKGNMVFDHMVCLCHFSPRSFNPWLAGETNCIPFSCRICRCYVYIFWSQLFTWSA